MNAECGVRNACRAEVLSKGRPLNSFFGPRPSTILPLRRWAFDVGCSMFIFLISALVFRPLGFFVAKFSPPNQCRLAKIIG